MDMFIKALLGASILVPAGAQAQLGPYASAKIEAQRGEDDTPPVPRPQAQPEQERSGRFRSNATIESDDGPRRERGGDRSASRPERTDDNRGFRQDRDGDRPAFRPQPVNDRPDLQRDRRDGDRTPGQFRDDRRNDISADRRDRRPEFGNHQRNDRRDWRDNRQNGWRGADRPQPGRNGWTFGGWNVGGYDRGRYDDRDYNNRSYDNRGYDNRGYDNQRGGNWNRGWHTDSRYDWNRYRSLNRSAYRLPRYYAPYGWNGGYRRFSVGITLTTSLWDRNYWIDDPYSYRLPEAYGPFRWVRYYDDALLIDIRNGRVIDTAYGIFW